MSIQSAARFSAGSFFIVLAFLTSGCASLQSERLPAASFSTPVELIDVPFFPQEEYQCGPSALATTLSWAGAATTPELLAPQLYVPNRQGTFQLELIASARRHGRVPYVLRPMLVDLLEEVNAGHPVVVLQNLAFAWYPRWHYAVVVGFNLQNETLILRSGRERRHVVSLGTFERTWQRGGYWAMVTTAPATVPHSAQEIPYLQAVAELEQRKRFAEANVAYRGALDRWPHSLGALLGLGNTHYSLKDVAAAERAYRRAAERHPQAADAYNNLAHVLAEQKRWKEAESAIHRALELGGPRKATYEKTLAEILMRSASH